MTHDDLDRSAAQDLDAADAKILADLRSLWDTVDPSPPGLTERVRFAMTVASLEAEVARIVEESRSPVGVRSDYERVNTVTFASDSVSAMIDIEVGGNGRVTVHGWVSQSPLEVELRERHRSRRTSVDATGRFSFEGVERGLVHFVLFVPGEESQQPVITPNIEL